MVVAPTKTKLLISCSKELKAKRYQNINIELKIADNTIRPTPSEKLLGVIISEDLTWTPYLWGESWRDKGNW